jgi:hypothetical protein
MKKEVHKCNYPSNKTESSAFWGQLDDFLPCGRKAKYKVVCDGRDRYVCGYHVGQYKMLQRENKFRKIEIEEL